MNDYDEIVTGRIVDGAGRPVEGARVEVYDKDMILDDYLGSTTTDAGGRFTVGFGWANYKDSPFEGRPDIFLKVQNVSTGKTYRSKVYYDLTGKLSDDDSEEVMDLGDVPVE